MTEPKTSYRVRRKLNGGRWDTLVEGSKDYCLGYAKALREVLVVTLRVKP